jgi:hypothetical protein
VVINNTINGNTVGIRVDRRINSSNYTIRNNILTNNGIGVEVDFGTEADNPIFQNNLVFGNTTNYDIILDQTGLNGNISANPLFVNAATKDFRLTSLSPAIDAGSSVGAPADDFAGGLRPQDGNGVGGAQYDIGAYEAVPEPSSALLALMGAGVLLRKQRKAR